MTDQDPAQIEQPKARSGRYGALIVGAIGAAALTGAGVFIALSATPSAQAAEGAEGEEKESPEVMRTRPFYEYEGIDLDEVSEGERNWYLVDERVWAHAEYAPPVATEELIARWREASLHDPEGQLDPERREALLRTIAEHARVRAQPEPDAYIELVESTLGTDWNTPDALRDAASVQIAYEAFVEAPTPESADTMSMLHQIWGGFARHGHLFEAIGLGGDGAAFLIRRVRTVREAMTQGLYGEHALPRTHWDGAYFQGGMRFAVEDGTLGEVLESSPSALVVNSHVLVRMGDGRLVNWIGVWFYDESADRWRPHYMQMSAPKLAKVVW